MMYSLDLRTCACRIYSILQSLRHTALFLGVSHTSVLRWLKNPQVKSRANKPSLKAEAISNIVKASIKLNPFVSTRQLQTKISDVLCISVSLELVRTVVQRLGLTRKKAKFFSCPKHLPTKTTHFLEQRDAFIKQGRKIFSIDETSFGRHGLVTTGYAIKGQRLYVEKKSPTLVSKSCLACATSTGWVKYQTCKGSVNTETFLDFLKSLNMPKNCVILLDNVSFHHSRLVKEFCESRNIELLFTPPYSPWFNPIELCFSVVKRQFSMSQVIVDSFESVKPQHFQKFFQKSLSCVSRF